MKAAKAIEDFSNWLHTKRGFVIQIEFFVLLCVLLHAIQVIFGWWRRCCRNKFLEYSLWLAYTASPSVMLYSLGVMRASSFMDLYFDIFDLSAMCVILALGTTNSMIAYSVEDNKQYTRHFVNMSLYVLNFISISPKASHMDAAVPLTAALLFLLISTILGSSYASMAASNFLDKETSNLEDHMKSEHTESTYYDPVTLEGYNYLVDRKITVSQIWLSNEGALGSGHGKQFKETCLSFALFRLLRRRFFGIACSESRLQKTRDLVFNGLLLDAEAAYRIIEVEMAFTYDHFFTSSASVHNKVGMLVMSISKAFIYPMFAVLWSQNLRVVQVPDPEKAYSSTTMATLTKFDVIIFPVIMVVLSALELLQLYLYFSSDWAKLLIVRLSSIGKMEISDLRFFILPRILGYWQIKIGQHSLLKDLHGRSITADMMGSLSWCCFGYVLGYHSVISRGIRQPGVKGPDHIQLTRDVKLAVARTLKTSNGQLSNGAMSLRRNAQCRLLWTCQHENHVSTMLIWHIATEYCELAQPLDREVQERLVSNRTIAVTLSCYCAYLMAFVPELLPGHELSSTKLFDKVRHEALDILSSERTLHAKYRTMKTFDVQPSDGRIFAKGNKLGRQLEEISSDDMRWKILADFWTEMILYIAPSDNAKAHIEHLAKGGEFLTHLWALLTHAGILERDERSIANIENTDADQPHPEELSFGAAWRLGRYLDSYRKGAPFTATNRPAPCGNPVHLVGTTVQQVHPEQKQNVEATSSDIEEIE